MKTITLYSIIISSLVLLTSCSQTEQTSNKIFEKGQKVTQNFTGETWVQMLTVDGENFDAMSYNVTFAAGSRTYWHSHPGGQILYCLSGEGRYQEKDGAIRSLKAGDVIEIKPDVVHWHGAGPDMEFVHLGISTRLSEGPANWYGPVTDEEYNNQK
ncbi:cupin domain-containing protein [Carboxylicivirga caseinilyticus]|uniref:cupin domain-containing protein n=1 Tax=Carboxylicivirga caseinilyticus TaxID=3417572 RepID=UPI003D3269E2|nr:cupin domain-containing protein [Marinilabiliaceae bacterium A049]